MEIALPEPYQHQFLYASVTLQYSDQESVLVNVDFRSTYSDIRLNFAKICVFRPFYGMFFHYRYFKFCRLAFRPLNRNKSRLSSYDGAFLGFTRYQIVLIVALRANVHARSLVFRHLQVADVANGSVVLYCIIFSTSVRMLCNVSAAWCITPAQRTTSKSNSENCIPHLASLSAASSRFSVHFSES